MNLDIVKGLASMPVIEFIGAIIALGIAIALAGALLGIMGVASAWIIGICFVTGWLPILMCATDPNWSITWELQPRDGFGTALVQRWAFLSTLVYMAFSFLTILISYLRPDPDGLPPAFKFLALFSVPDAVGASRGVRFGTSAGLTEAGFFDSIMKKTTSVYEERILARALKKEAEIVEAEGERVAQATRLAQAHDTLAQEQRRAQTVKEIKKSNE